MTESVTQWVCDCCISALANAEGCSCYDDLELDPWEPWDEQAPKSTHPAGLTGKLSRRASYGMREEDHNCFRHDEPDDDDDLLDLDDSLPTERPEECDCETRTYDTSACDGCGSANHGARHAVTDEVEYEQPTPALRVVLTPRPTHTAWSASQGSERRAR
ncbi:hypothetical protein [Streptacidiphilus neutrinimicus]|uniref:hypothetical protein n=1 Tax=Streptacidiphilus neutrinimicus TaxID=105420 RepID=UPI0005A9EE4C|nr:hypothetical protein [Streptacidiphilus neutrinimicus]